MSSSLSMAITACRSSRDLEDTRTSSPWIRALTPLGKDSRMALVIFLAFSWLRPSRSGQTSL